MTNQALEYCVRGIVQYLAGDVDKFKYFVNKRKGWVYGGIRQKNIQEN